MGWIVRAITLDKRRASSLRRRENRAISHPLKIFNDERDTPSGVSKIFCSLRLLLLPFTASRVCVCEEENNVNANIKLNE